MKKITAYFLAVCLCCTVFFMGCSNDKNNITDKNDDVSDSVIEDEELNSKDEEALEKEVLKETDENSLRDNTENSSDEESSQGNEEQGDNENQGNINETDNNSENIGNGNSNSDGSAGDSRNGNENSSVNSNDNDVSSNSGSNGNGESSNSDSNGSEGSSNTGSSGNSENNSVDSNTSNSANTNANTTTSTGTTPLEQHGALHVDGVNLVDEYGRQMQLYGMSTHGLSWFPQYVSYDTFKTLRDDWNTNCIRLAMYTAEYNGYCTGGSKEELKSLIDSGVSYATDLGMYVIIDWHVLNDNNPNVYKSEAIAFFNEMSAKYADRKNVIYEICNEPNGSTSWEDIKTYANEVIPVIRANDKDAVIIVGTPTWSQDIDKALASPLDFDNVMYALHFYAATHTDWLRNRVTQCISGGLPVFISEFGICDASGSGGIDYNQAQQWMSLIKQYNLSYCCWNLSNKSETSSVIGSWCSSVSGWSDSDLSEAGKWIRNQFKSED